MFYKKEILGLAFKGKTILFFISKMTYFQQFQFDLLDYIYVRYNSCQNKDGQKYRLFYLIQIYFSIN